MVPVLQALLFADRIYRLQDGGMVIAGTVNQLGLGSPPKREEIEHPDGRKGAILQARQPATPSIYVCLTDVHDDTEVSIQLVSLSENAVLLRTMVHIEKGERLGTVEIVAPLPPLDVIQKPGAYALEVVCEDEILGMHRFEVLRVDQDHEDENVTEHESGD